MIYGAAVVTGYTEPVELDGGVGVRLLRELNGLQTFAEAFVESRARRAAGLWQHEDRFYAVRFEAVTEQGRPAARVELAETAVPYGLTVRELDVVTLMTGGLSNNEIGALLGSGGRTVGKHVERILEKLGQSSRAGVTAVAVEEGLIRLPLPAGGRALVSLAVGRVQALVNGRAVRPAHRRPAPQRPFIVGSAYPSSGYIAADGAEMTLGSALAVAEINARGGVAGRRVEQIVVDVDPSDAVSVTNAMESLIAQEVDAVTSGWMYAEQAALDAVSPYGCPYLNAFTSEFVAEQVREQQTEYGSIFQVCATEATYGLGFIRTLDELRATGSWAPRSRRITFIEAPVQSGHIATRDTIARAERSGWEVADLIVIPSPVVNWEGVIARIHASDPAAVMLAHWLPEDTARFQRQFVANPTDALLYSIYSPSVPAYLAEAGPAAEGLLWSTVTGSYGDTIGRAFGDRFEAAFGRTPGRSHAGIAYDEIHLLAGAWARVGNPRRFTEVSSELGRVPYRGVNGVYYLGGESHCALSYPDTTNDPSLGQAHLVLQVQDGESRVLAPGLYAEAQFRTPPWMRHAAHLVA